MKKVLQLEDLSCAHCATKMENAIKKINGVTDASINFITQKLVIEVKNGVINEIIEKAEKICKRIEPDCRIVR